MVELNIDEETCLEELIKHEMQGGDVDEFIRSRLGSLDHSWQDSEGGQHSNEDPNYKKFSAIYDSLVVKRMLVRSEMGSHRELTCDGRAYFRDKEIHAEERRREVRREWTFQVVLVVLSIVLGLLAGYVGQRLAQDIDGDPVYHVEVVRP